MLLLPQAQLMLLNFAGGAPVIAFWLFVLSQATSRRWKTITINAGILLMTITLACLAAVLLVRALEAGRFPLSNLYESLLWFALFVSGAFLYITFSQGKASSSQGTEGGDTGATAAIGWMAALIAASVLLYGSWLPAAQHEIKPLVPALMSYWRQIHVPPLICSYALFFIAGCTGLLQLYNFGCLRSVIILIATLIAAAVAIALGTFTEIDTWILQAIYAGSSVLGVVAAWKQLAHRALTGGNAALASLYDEIGSRCINIGVPLLTFGIVTGGLWANHAWGTYWSWDPKESMALTTWLSYVAYMHLRVHHELPAQKLSVVAVIGLLLTLLTYLGFNSLGFGGLHSYGRFKL